MAEEKKKGILGFLASLADPESGKKIQEKKEQLLLDKNRRQSAQAMKGPAASKEDIVSGQPYLPKVGKSHTVAGLFYREENAMKLAFENPYFKMDHNSLVKKGYTGVKIFKYSFKLEPVTLVQEPENPHDPSAIMVMVDGQHIGYIKAGSCAHVNKLINEGRIAQILCRISGGPFKAVYLNEDENPRKKPTYSTDQGKHDLRAEIRIVEKTSIQ